MRLVTSKFCAGLEGDSGLWTIRNIFERITVTGGYPCPMPPLNLAIEIEVALGDAVGPVSLRAALCDEDGGLIAQIDGHVVVDAPLEGIPSRQWVSLVFLPGSVISRPGVFRCDITVGGQLIGGERIIFAAA